MPRLRSPLTTPAFALISIICGISLGANAFGPEPLPRTTVVEYYNVRLNHYFLTANATEMAVIDAGQAGPGWVRTGYGFSAYPIQGIPGMMCFYDCGLQVSRFHGTPGLGPNSHFYTLDTVEAEGLKRPGSGWSYEGPAFSIPAPDSTGQCPAGHVPVYRLYNNRWMYNDSNHRYVTNAALRDRMRAEGWIDEGAKMCTSSAADDVPIRSFVAGSGGDVLPSSECEDETRHIGGCIAVNNLPVPRAFLTGWYSQSFGQVTGMITWVTKGIASGPPEVTSKDLFVQLGGDAIGIHVDTKSRGDSEFSSVNPLYQMRTSIAADGSDPRVFPFTDNYETDAEIAIKFVVNVRSLVVRSAGGAAIGHPTIEFIDQRSGRHLYFTVLAYGSFQPESDYLAPDVVTGKVIVSTSFRGSTPYGRSLGIDTLFTPSGFSAQNVWGNGGPFDFRMNREEFSRVLASARQIDPALSADPRDYLLDNFHFNNEVYGDGEIGVNLTALRLEIVRR